MQRSEGESVVKLSGVCLGLTGGGGGGAAAADEAEVDDVVLAEEEAFNFRPSFPGLHVDCLACCRHLAL